MRLINEEETADIIVTAPQGQSVLVVEVKRRPLDSDAYAEVNTHSRTINPEYVMAVDLKPSVLPP